MGKSIAQERKERPMWSGLMKYFPDALEEVAYVSFIGNEQHNPGTPLHWDRTKSMDQLDAGVRHLKDHATGVEIDSDGVRHLAKAAWRILAQLQLDLEKPSEHWLTHKMYGRTYKTTKRKRVKRTHPSINFRDNPGVEGELE